MKKLLVLLLLLAAAPAMRAAVKLADPAPGDPFKAETWRLANGVTVVIAPNPIPGRVYVAELFRVGSVDDPADKTGLAHYLEHLLFKGSERLGTTDYAAEKPLLEEIEKLYAKRENSSDPAERDAIYRQIDRLSGMAAKYAVPNEYDRLIDFLGGSELNAFTGNYYTCYVAELPPESLPPFFAVELDRFSAPVFRGFHTELEAVYEELNMYMDVPARRAYDFINRATHPGHPRGVPIAGTAEDLRNPSPARVMEFFRAHYAPRNMVVILAGDVTAAAVLPVLEETLGKLPDREPAPHHYRPLPAPAADTVESYTTQLPSSAMFQWPLYGLSEEERTVADVAAMVLGDGLNGIMAKEFALTGRAADYSVWFAETADGNAEFIMYVTPAENDSDAAAAMLEEALKKLQNGDFSEEQLKSAAMAAELELMSLADAPEQVAQAIADAVGNGSPLWNDAVKRVANCAEVSKAEVVRFAGELLSRPKYVIKLDNGNEAPPEKLEKPPITPLEYGEGGSSELFRTITGAPPEPPRMDPPDPDRDFPATPVRSERGGVVQVRRQENSLNELFEVTIVFSGGRDQDPVLPFACGLFDSAGAGSRSAEELNAELARLGGEMSMRADLDCAYLTVSGPGRFFREIMLIAAERLADPTVSPELIAAAAKAAADARKTEKNDRAAVCGAFLQRELRMENSTYLRRPSVEGLAALTPEAVEKRLEAAAESPALVYFYGSAENFDEALELPEALRLVGTEDGALPRTAAPEAPGDRPRRVYVINDPARRQNLIVLYRHGKAFDPEDFALRLWFNNYYGGDMSSLLFQTLREARGLCYGVGGSYVTPSSPAGSHFFTVNMTTQADKSREALEGLLALGMPEDPERLEETLKSTRNLLKYTRFKGSKLMRLAESYRKMGLPSDYRAKAAEQSERLTPEMLAKFYAEEAAGYDSILIVGTPPDMEFLSGLGEVVELEFSDLFRD